MKWSVYARKRSVNARKKETNVGIAILREKS